MRLLGHILLWLGFFAGSFVMLQHLENPTDRWATINWTYYGGAFLIGTIGVVLLRVTAKQAGGQAHEINRDMDELDDALEKLIAGVSKLNTERESILVFDVHKQIDDSLAIEFGRFADARKSMIQRFDLQTYAAIMTEFANAERGVNRAWSASADGYVDEVWLSLERAERRLLRAREIFDHHLTRAGATTDEAAFR